MCRQSTTSATDSQGHRPLAVALYGGITAQAVRPSSITRASVLQGARGSVVVGNRERALDHSKVGRLTVAATNDRGSACLEEGCPDPKAPGQLIGRSTVVP